MSVHPTAPAEADASPRRKARGEAASARARLEVLQALLMALLAALCGTLPPLAPLHAARAEARPIPRLPLFDPHGVPGLTTARHRGPVPPRAYRLGRFPLWWARNRGARAIPRHAPELRPAPPSRGPPQAPRTHQSRKNAPTRTR